VVNAPIGALVHLGLARAYSLQGDNPKARAAYQEFLTLWKDADSDIPILKVAKAEYAKLHPTSSTSMFRIPIGTRHRTL
jgi:eukaryotic-like serine/threonine-protein kinase